MHESADQSVGQGQQPAQLLKKFEDIGTNSPVVFLNELNSDEYLDCSYKLSKVNSYYEPDDTRIGNLLLEFSLITKELLESSLEEAYELGIPLGRILVMSGWVTQTQLNWTVQLQSLIRDNMISKQIAIQISELINSSNLTFNQALEVSGCSQYLTSSANRLGDLLKEADLISEEDLSKAIYKSQYLGLPLGRCLSLTGLISEKLLDTAINAQKFTRQGKISREDAVFAIKKASIRYASEPALNEHTYSSINKVRLGELLCIAGIVTEAQIEYAIELGLLNNLPVGKVLLDLGLLSERTLESALILQVIVSQSNLSAKEAAFALIDIHYHGYTISRALDECSDKQAKVEKPNFKQFIASLGILNTKEIEEALEDSLSSPYIVSKALMYSGVINDSIMQLALCVHFYLREGFITSEESMILFNHANLHNISLADALEDLGIEVRTTQTIRSAEECIVKYLS